MRFVTDTVRRSESASGVSWLLPVGFLMALMTVASCTPMIADDPVQPSELEVSTVPRAAPQTRRLTDEQYRQSIADIFGGDIRLGGRFDPLVRTDGLLAVAASNVVITPSALEKYENLAQSIAAQVVDRRHRDFLIGCKPQAENKPDRECSRRFLSVVGRELYRRPLESGELKDVVNISDASTAKLGDFYAGLAYGLSTLLVSPDFLFIHENVEPDPARRGSYRLDSFSMASKLSFLLWNSTPDDELLDAAERGKLHTKEGLRQQVDRMLSSPRLEGSVRAFFADMLGFESFETLEKDLIIYPAFGHGAASDAREQTLRTIVDHIVIEKADYRDLFTTRKTYMSSALGAIYRVPVQSRNGWVPYELPKDRPSAGIVSQISFLALHSHPGRSSATLRGKAVRELFLCQKVPDPPGNVDFTLASDTANPNFRTARQRLTAHRSEVMCAGCHKIMDPVGLVLENFDGAGQFRTEENGAPIIAEDTFNGRPILNASDLGQSLHDDPAAASCLVNRLFSYANGRAPLKEEKELLGAFEAEFRAGGYRVTTLLRHIALSDAFYAVTAPDESPREVRAHLPQNSYQGGKL